MPDDRPVVKTLGRSGGLVDYGSEGWQAAKRRNDARNDKLLAIREAELVVLGRIAKALERLAGQATTAPESEPTDKLPQELVLPRTRPD